ncbi:MAG TPA: hypothetical protein VFX94_01135 [Burkholderiales bacterium]|nr:hypothetical protein [Burkholderiales bacterium]
MFTDLTAKELAFRELIAGVEVRPGRVEINPTYSLECAAARLRWERANIVWFHGTNEKGDPVWSRERPGPELAARLMSHNEHVYMRRVDFLAAWAEAKETGKPQPRFVLVRSISG